MTLTNYGRRARTLLTAFGLAGALGACDNEGLLEVNNPGAVADADLDDPLVQQQIVNTVVGDFQRMYDDLVFAGALLSDEADNGHNFTQWIDINRREIDPTNSIMNSDIYAPLQRARAGADNLAERLRTSLGASAATDPGLARVLAFAGYGNLILGEYFCESPVKEDQPALTSSELYARAIGRFDEAIQIAKSGEIANLAKVGAARAALQQGDKAKAIQYATGVPAGFVFWLNYSENKGYQNNRLDAAANGSGRYIGVSSKFRNLNDPRVRHNATAQSGHSPDGILYSPRLGPSHTGFNPAAAGLFTKTTGIRLASGLEAQYIIAEAQGLNAANLAFINSRRAVGGAAPLPATITPAEFLAEVRDQRRRDFFLDGHRLGDIRRYKAQYGVDEFRKGTHPVASWGVFEAAECFVPTRNEQIGNPAY